MWLPGNQPRGDFAMSVDAATGQKTMLKKRKTKLKVGEEALEEQVSDSETSVRKKPKKWQNRQRVLVFCARGVTYRARHLMNDMRTLMPHSRTDTKLDRKDRLLDINDVCEMKNCTKCIFFEMRKKKDIYLWFSNVPNGPSAKFLVSNVHTMDELKLTGNCLLGSRPLLTFDPAFSSSPQFELLRELFTQIFSTPYYHPKSKPFIDHVFHFGILDDRVWFRNYQIVDGGRTLTEIGPRFVMNLIKVFEGSFGGPTLYENPKYVTPNAFRRLLKAQASSKYNKRTDARRSLAERRQQEVEGLPQDPLSDIFETI